ncbi:MAG TPA: nitrate ABC transporter substrate-binding protein, partial [Cupriavidus sp.]|nr:nitrate ABC transporter substrate-binding protein [Cupriavidus sp.]
MSLFSSAFTSASTLTRRAAVAMLTAGLALTGNAHAEGRLRIAEQFGVVYLLLNVARDQQLIEKHGKQ